MNLYMVYDTIAEKGVVSFFATNEADARRYVRGNFAGAAPALIDGFTLCRVGGVVEVFSDLSVEKVPVVELLPAREPDRAPIDHV